VEPNRGTWSEALKLAVVISVVAAVAAVTVRAVGDVPQAVIVLPVILIAFTLSWIQTGRVRRLDLDDHAVPSGDATRRTAA
jgi:hypothetical protein